MKIATSLAALAFAAASLASHAGRLADLSLVDRATGRELPLHWHEGRAYVVGKPGNEYKVVLRNRRSEDLLAVVSVDGVNVLTGQTASADQGGYVVGARDRLDITGWRKSLGEVASFYFTSLGDSYAGRTQRPANVGVIGVAFFRRAVRHDVFPEPSPLEWEPKAERQQAPAAADSAGSHAKRDSRLAQPSAPLGTGHGRRHESRAYYTAFERATREPEESLAIYYDSYRNLVAMGVLQPYAQRRDPQPFPSAFVPDP